MSELSSPDIRTVNAEQVLAHLPMRAAVDALKQALLQGFDPSQAHTRTSAGLTHGEFLMMPSEFGDYAGVKILTVGPGNPQRGLPKIQGQYLLFDADTLAPLALIDGVALTAIRTPAVSALGVDILAAPDASDLLVFGTGPQAEYHVRAVAAVREISRVGIVGRSGNKTDRLVAALNAEGFNARTASEDDVAGADIITCCTAASEPLFDGEAVRDGAVVVAMGSHTPDARETDDALARRAAFYVEDVDTALREAGDAAIPIQRHLLRREDLRDLSTMVSEGKRTTSRPALFKTVGMGWQDLVTAKALFENLPG
ncbi:ornithine cyclodeaminase family protein [Kocuria massiliensis]|uniref:ornithine cyclodeaminase family protein n=1 Tax=Kocuria massiliensis TaxID=1926282 RepID=UPI0022B9B4FB|nr:ornithine cyclodeaminase family protein [Kocuria massiliensis]